METKKNIIYLCDAEKKASGGAKIIYQHSQIINSFTAKFNGNTVFEVDMRPSVSSNPFIVFPFKVREAGTFDFIWVEDGGQEYTASKKMKLA